MNATAKPYGCVPAAVNMTTLTRREHQIMVLLVEGCSNKQMAESLALSVKTVEKFRMALYAKAGVNTQIGLIRVALRAKWVGLDAFFASREGEVRRVEIQIPLTEPGEWIDSNSVRPWKGKNAKNEKQSVFR